MTTPVVTRHGRIAIMESWLVAHRDFHQYMSLEDAKELLTALDDAVKAETALQRVGGFGTRVPTTAIRNEIVSCPKCGESMITRRECIEDLWEIMTRCLACKYVESKERPRSST